ncbi:MAG: FAD/NAD(P)-binding protein [Trueperaceae bacterium]|nr:FAD/NAD(P)-binding protein [Trueperaceae bacterium]
MMPTLYTVDAFHQDNHDTFTLDLHAPTGSVLSFEPGQFNMLYVFGVGEIPISISSDPADTSRLLHTTRVVGTVTRAMSNLRPGDTIGVRGPFGHGWPLSAAEGKDVVIVTGGIGLAPLRPALYAMLGARDRFGKIVLLYGARTPEDILYWEELEAWRARFDLEVHVTVDRATGDWRGNVGVVTKLIPRAPFDPRNTVSLTCGPEIMMRFTTQELAKRGVAGDDVFVSMERNMKCAVGLCGHCQYGPSFVCKDGPVYPYPEIASIFGVPEV